MIRLVQDLIVGAVARGNVDFSESGNIAWLSLSNPWVWLDGSKVRNLAAQESGGTEGG